MAKAKKEVTTDNKSVDVVETVQASPAEGWNKDIEIANLVDANSTNLHGPRKSGGLRPGVQLNVTGVDKPPQNSESTDSPNNGNVLDHGLNPPGTNAKMTGPTSNKAMEPDENK